MLPVGEVILEVDRLFPLPDPVERRLGDVDPALFHQLLHVPEEKGEEQRPDVRSVDVGVGHDDDLAVPQAGRVEIVLADAGAQGRDHRPDLLRREHLVDARLFHIQDLPLEREDGLEPAIPGLLGRAPRRVPLDQKQFAQGRVLLLAVREFPGETGGVERPFPPRKLFRLPGGVPCPCGLEPFLDDLARHRGVLLEEGGQLLVDERIDKSLDLAVAELGLGLSLELGLGHFHGNDRGQPLAYVVPGQVLLDALEQIPGVCVLVDRPGQSGAKTDEVRSSLVGVDVVREGEDGLLIRIVVLEGHLRLNPVPLPFHEDRLGVQGGLVPVQVLDEGVDPPLVLELVGLAASFVEDGDPKPRVEKRQLAQPSGKDIEGEFGFGEDLRVGPERHLGAGLPGFARRLEGRHRLAPREADPVDGPVPAHLRLELLGQGVHHGDAYPVQPARNLVGRLVELPAGVQGGQNHLDGGLSLSLHHVDGDSTAVVVHGHGIVLVDGDLDVVAVPGHCLVNGVIHDFVDEVVEPVGIRAPDVHGRPFPDGLQTP